MAWITEPFHVFKHKRFRSSHVQEADNLIPEFPARIFNPPVLASDRPRLTWHTTNKKIMVWQSFDGTNILKVVAFSILRPIALVHLNCTALNLRGRHANTAKGFQPKAETTYPREQIDKLERLHSFKSLSLN